MTTKATVLVVDDQESNRYTTRLMLQQAGFEVKEAATGYEGLRLAGEPMRAARSARRPWTRAPTAT